MKAFFSEAFLKSLKKHNSIKTVIQRKVDLILQNPVAFGEPLKGNFRGYYSCPVRKNFLVIYLYCKACRAKGDAETVLCKDCHECPEDTVKFAALGPHDKAYRKKEG